MKEDAIKDIIDRLEIMCNYYDLDGKGFITLEDAVSIIRELHKETKGGKK